jgi:enoyl-CoA hydratase/carnithine racemase
LVGSRKVTIAAVHGHCLGGGAELAMICDLVYTTDSARWGFPEINLGCYPPVACALLGSIVGQRRGAEMILTGRTIDGSEAAKIGLATAAVAESELGPAVEECVKRLWKLSPSALALAKKASSSWDSMNFDRNLARAEQIYLEELIHTADAHEGIRAFVEKREPKWIGK